MVVPHHRLSSFLGLVASLVAILGCKPKPAPASGPRSPSEGRCSRSGGTLNNLPMNNLPMNNLPMNNLPMNGLSQESLAVHHALFDALSTTALRQNLFEDPALASALVSPLLKPGQVSYAPELVKYIAACALDPCDWIDAPPGLSPDALEKLADYSVISGNEADRTRKGFVGELGLCGAGSKDTRWASEAPRKDHAKHDDREPCLERVSACMLARTNALEAKVMISLRGAGLELSERVPTNTLFRDHGGTPIASFSPRASCTEKERTNRHGNCGWQPLFVGQCVHAIDGGGTRRVSLAVEGESRDVELRVCEGIFGCDDREGQPITVVGGSKARPPYAGDVIAAGTDGVTFACGDLGPRRGGPRHRLLRGDGSYPRRPSAVR